MMDKTALEDQRMLDLIAAGKLRLPDNELLANIYRRRGDLAAAAAEYDRLFALGVRSSNVALFRSVFRQQQGLVLPPASAFAPAPFVLFEQFFDPAANRALLDHAVATQALFHQTEVYKAAQGQPPNRTNLVTYELGPFGDAMRTMVTRHLPAVCERLGKARFDIRFIQLKIAAYANGDFFKPHHDNGENNPERVISFVYYFNQVPKPYAGGDLILYDTRFQPSAYVRSLFTRIVPQNNSIIFFPSEYFHEVSTVRLDGDAFNACRFTMAGHVG